MHLVFYANWNKDAALLLCLEKCLIKLFQMSGTFFLNKTCATIFVSKQQDACDFKLLSRSGNWRLPK